MKDQMRALGAALAR